MSRFFTIFCVFLTAFAMFLSVPADAATTDKKTAKELEVLFSQILEQQQRTATMNGITMDWQGQLLVEPLDYYYAVTFPSLTMTNPDQSYINIGKIALNVMPTEIPDSWKITGALPSPVISYKPDGTIGLRIDVGQQNFAGIWHEKLQNFIRFNARYENVKISTPSENVSVTISVVSSVLDMNENTAGQWSGPARFTIENIQADGPMATVRIKKMSMDMDIMEYDLEEAISFRENISALAESYGSGDVPSLSGSHILGMYDLFLGSIGTIWDGFTMTFNVEGLETTKSATVNTEEEKFNLGKAGFGFGLTGFHSDSVTLNFSSEYSGLSLPSSLQDFNEATPTDLNIDISINALPFRALLDLGRDSLKMVFEAPALANMAGIQAVMRAPQILTEAGTNLVLKDVFLGGDNYHILMNGMITANLNAVMGAEGKVRMEVLGLDKLLSLLNEQLQNPDNNSISRENAKKTRAALTILSLIGQQDKNDKGQDIRIYNFELTEQGESLINGTDITTLFDLPTAQ